MCGGFITRSAPEADALLTRLHARPDIEEIELHPLSATHAEALVRALVAVEPAAGFAGRFEVDCARSAW